MLFCYGDYMEEHRRLCKWEDNPKMVPKEMGVYVMYWMELAQDPC